jgi:RNA polymerase II subunit A C-terminal domain phosphatase SSU72
LITVFTMSTDPRLRARQQQAAAAPVPPPPPPPPAEPNPMGMDGANDAHAESNMVADDKFKLKFCTVCASNQNRYVGSDIAIALLLT